MKNMALKLLFWANYMMLIFYMSWHIKAGQTKINICIPLFLSSLMLIDITYISSCNIRENKVIWLFCGLLALDSWYVLLSFQESIIENFIFIILSPIIWYMSIKFILMFLFQGSGYQFQKTTNIILLITCIGSLAGIGISHKSYACLYGIQILSNCFCFLLIVLYHWKRVTFVLKSEWQCILFSITIITTLFFVYYFATIEVQNHISNCGLYLPILLFFMSVHGIVWNEHSSFPLSTVFNRIQTTLIICVSLLTLGLIILLAGGSYEELVISINALFAFIYICNIILEWNLKKGQSKIMKESKYHAALQHLWQEEQLKTKFANFLHDDVLQDLLSIKNMMTKAHRPDIQDIVIETLDNLNTLIREQMQDYHPVILKNLTAKKNYQNLIEAISQSFPQRNITVSFDCSDQLFLVEPYNILIYRLLKELLTNVYKHSNGSQAWVMLTQKNSIITLSVSDDGTAAVDCLTFADKVKHNGIPYQTKSGSPDGHELPYAHSGLASIAEQVTNVEGSMIISDNTPHGIRVQIQIPMKGDVSYQYFVS